MEKKPKLHKPDWHSTLNQPFPGPTTRREKKLKKEKKEMQAH